MNITCIIATRNPADCNALIAQLRAYDHHVVVVHPASTAAPVGVVSITTPTLISPAAARNLGATTSNTDLLCFLDDDIIMRGDVPHMLSIVFAAPHIVACGAVIYDHPSNDAWQRAFHRMAMAPQYATSARRIPPILTSMALMVRRTTFHTIGGFDETFTTPAGEDADLSLRLRHHGIIMTLPQARIYHLPHPAGWRGVTRRSWHYGTVWPCVRQRHPQFTARIPLPSFIISIVVALVAPALALYDTARTRRSGYWVTRWWLRTWWYLGVAWGEWSC
jgi:GT2 family glycosyltransferase